MSFAGYFLARSLLSAFPAYLRTFFRFDFVWFRLSCDHGWIRSGSVDVRYDLQCLNAMKRFDFIFLPVVLVFLYILLCLCPSFRVWSAA